ncbi:hypothetical protein [Peloplasma aerotolerans]|uniref:NfeD-like C-terminal domain-containing protein n=1 Tax=Peloplasma aerotolerans TaxID=3044389 RepID=A0AAW6U4F5_9MOLU|nr:hypothetical protein [Mariniplasma sp. M4Ah]MDI6452792.1 hypothetical protein [Mariniplasma sp. M4Ah]MDR4968049.1 hypothetical protein [Acholeplasmataceae bacterium]
MTLQQIAFILAVTATVIMLIFLLLMIFGVDDSTFDGGFQDADLDFLADEPLSAISGLKILTIRGMLVFFSIGGWVVFIIAPFMHILLVLLLGLLAGILASYLQAIAFKAALNLESSGNLDYKRTIGKVATVYIRIPKERSGKGKVILTLEDRFIEVDAITDDHLDLLSKTMVDIVGLENDTTLVVSMKK